MSLILFLICIFGIYSIVACYNIIQFIITMLIYFEILQVREGIERNPSKPPEEHFNN